MENTSLTPLVKGKNESQEDIGQEEKEEQGQKKKNRVENQCVENQCVENQPVNTGNKYVQKFVSIIVIINI